MSVYRGDRLEFTQQAVQSILNQTYKDFDFHIILDGPIGEDVEGYLDSLSSDSRIKLYKRVENKGLAYSLNELLSKTLGKYAYYARMDADDIALPERFSKQVEYMESNPDCDCVGAWAIEIDENNEEYFRKEMPVTQEECYAFFEKRDCMIHPTVMFRNTYLAKAGLYPEDTYFGEDTMMWAKGFAAGCVFHNIPEYLFLFRINRDFFSRRRGWKHAIGIFKLRRRVNKLLHYGSKADFYAVMYMVAKLMPKSILNIIYKKAR
ncbi:MAG: glycosyltransferase [Bacteroides sp.]|nr:glycosyltransferase [Bacteroides sp.]